MNEDGMLKPALIGGILLGVLSSLPYLNICCILWIIGGGLLAAHVYIRESTKAVTLGRGAALGLLSGIFGTIVYVLFLLPQYLLNKAGFVGQLSKSLGQMPNLSPETRQAMSAMLSHEGTVVFLLVFTFFFILVVFCLLAMLGGTLGVAIFEKRTPNSGHTSATNDAINTEEPGKITNGE